MQWTVHHDIFCPVTPHPMIGPCKGGGGSRDSVFKFQTDQGFQDSGFKFQKGQDSNIELYRITWFHNQHLVTIIGQLWKASLLCKTVGDFSA